jgi:hypothetical protein
MGKFLLLLMAMVLLCLSVVIMKTSDKKDIGTNVQALATGRVDVSTTIDRYDKDITVWSDLTANATTATTSPAYIDTGQALSYTSEACATGLVTNETRTAGSAFRQDPKFAKTTILTALAVTVAGEVPFHRMN